jgi:succinoglycan biosynthesis protein ExoA
MSKIVSIIVPCYNEEKTIQQVLEGFLSQSYPRQFMEVIIADGLSTDETRREIATFARDHEDLSITVLDNPKRIIPAALNLALQAAHGDIILRFDGHSIPYPDYVETCVRDLEAGLGEIVGGTWEIRPGAETWIARSIAAAAAHPLGVGDALYRHSDKPAYVDTVPFGAFKKALLASVGNYDENLMVNEDYEFNTRVREHAGRIWMNPAIRSIYFARSTLRGLVKQYWRYGFWKYHMLRQYPHSLRWRQALPPLFVLSIIALLVLGCFFNPIFILLGIEILLYIAIMLGAGILSACKHHDGMLMLGLPTTISSMHLAWGSGFLWGIIKGLFKSGKAETA